MELNTYNIDSLAYKQLLKSLKEDIKKNVELQREYKRHRKTEHFSGERIKVTLDMDIYEARYYFKGKEYELSSDLAVGLHKHQRDILRAMYATYGVLRCKSLMQIESCSKYRDNLTEDNHPLNYWKNDMQKIVDKYLVQNDGSSGK